MTASDKKKTAVLVFLLVVGGFSYYYVYRPTSGAISTTAAKPPSRTKPAKVGQDAEIRSDLIGKIPFSDVGQKNLFQYRQRPAPPKPPQTAAVMPQVYTPPPPANPQPYTPPPVPFKAFRYEGFSVAKNGKILGSITEGGTTYAVNEGECLMGQYCVTRLTENLVEIEDLLLKRRQTFTRVQ